MELMSVPGEREEMQTVWPKRESAAASGGFSRDLSRRNTGKEPEGRADR